MVSMQGYLMVLTVNAVPGSKSGFEEYAMLQCFTRMSSSLEQAREGNNVGAVNYGLLVNPSEASSFLYFTSCHTNCSATLSKMITNGALNY